jgi:prophage regulatory protein
MVTKILRLPEVIARTGMSRSTIYLRIQSGDFPKPIPLGPRMVGWPESAIEKHLCSIIDQSVQGEIGI